MSQRNRRDAAAVVRLRCSLWVVFILVAAAFGWRVGIGAYGNERVAVDRARDHTPDGLGASDWAGIRDAYERHRHEVVAAANEPGVWQARNPGQQWRTRFDQNGFLVEPMDGEWTWGLVLTSYGTGETLHAVDAIPRVSVEGQRVTYRRGAQLDEWFINDRRGLEHGFTVHARPTGGTGPVVLDLTVRGPLKPQVRSDGRGVTFGRDDVSVVNYTGLKVFDADGRKLSARFERRDDETVRLRFDDTGTRYPITIDPIAQQAYLKASNARLGELFGASVAISGDTAVVGARFEDSDATGVNGDQTNTNAPSSGAAYVFVRTGSGWSQQAYLKASNTDGVGIGDQFGCSVSVSGDTLVVGALFEGSDATGVDGDQTNNNAAQSGAAYVFVRNGSTWRQQAYLKASNTNAPDQFGSRVALSGDTLVIGAPGESSNATGVDGDQTNNNAAQSGAAYVFVRSDTVWSQQVYLKASNTGGGDRFGSSVAISTDTIVVGASGEDSDAKGVDGDQSDNSALDSGAAYVFVRNGGAWNQQAYLKASNADPGDMFGAVAISGNTVVVGAVSEDSNATGVDGDQSDNSTLDSGAAYVFVRSDTIWSQQAYLKAFNTGAGDSFGSSVGISRNIVVVVAMFEDSNATGVDGDDTNNSTLDSGAAYVIVRSGSTWIPKAYLKASNTGAEDRFGTSVAAAGSTIVVGAISEDSNATGVNGDEVNESASFAGAAYVFTIDAPDFHPPIDYEIVSRNSGKCLDVSYASTEAVASVIQWICHGGANQQWRLEPVGDGAFRIIARHSGQVLDVYGGFVDDVTPVIQYPWHGGDNQLWTLEPTSNGYVFLVAQHSGKVLDVEYASPDDGARVIQYTLHGGANQQWLLHAVAPAADPMSTVSEREP